MKRFFLSRGIQWWGDLPLGWKGATVLLIPVTALICGFASVYLVGVKENEAEMWLAHSAAVRYHIQEVLTPVVDAESAVRGFVISHNPRFLALYHASLEAFPRRTRELTNLVANSRAQSDRANEIKTLAQKRLNLIAAVVGAATQNDQASIRERELQSITQEEEVMDKLRPNIAAMDDEELRLQEARNHVLQFDRELCNNVIRLSTIVGVLGGVAGMFLFSKGIERRIRKIQTNAERLAKEAPLEPMFDRRDEIGQLGRRLTEASKLLSDKREALRESESRLQAVLDNAPSVMYVKDLNGRFILVNRALASLLDRSTEEIIGKTGREIYPMKEAKIFEANDRFALEAGHPVQVEEVLQRKDGTHTFISSKFALLDSNGKAYALGGISTDVTERARNAAALSSAKAEAERANHAKSEFLSRMSHEFRTPLHAILGFAQILKKEEAANDRDCVDHILRDGYHLLRLVNKLLDITRIETGDFRASIDSMDVEEVLEPSNAHQLVEKGSND